MLSTLSSGTLVDVYKFDCMGDCSCKRGQKYIHFCDEKNCPNFKNAYFCALCADKLDGKHLHTFSTIARHVYEGDKNWKSTI